MKFPTESRQAEGFKQRTSHRSTERPSEALHLSAVAQLPRSLAPTAERSKRNLERFEPKQKLFSFPPWSLPFFLPSVLSQGGKHYTFELVFAPFPETQTH